MARHRNVRRSTFGRRLPLSSIKARNQEGNFVEIESFIHFQAAMFPPALYSHLKSAGKDMIVVLNKVDLVPLPVAIAWKHSLLEAHPGIRRVQY